MPKKVPIGLNWPGFLAPRRLDRDHEPRRGRYLRPIRLDDQPRRHALGTSEIYRAVLALAEVEQALVVDADGWMPLFVVLSPGVELDEPLLNQIARQIREDCSPRHVPNGLPSEQLKLVGTDWPTA
jgi:hypothetical protein